MYESRGAYYRNREEIDVEDHILATYWVESASSLAKGAEEIAIGQSAGTWVSTKYETPDLIENYGAKIIGMYGDKQCGVVEIAFPSRNLDEVGGLPQLMVMLAGSLYDISDLTNVRLLDFRLPGKILRRFKGPKFGMDGVRGLLGVKDRPLLGTIVKPDIGAPPEVVAQVCYEAASGGVDFIKDDEVIVNPEICPLEERVPRVAESIDKANEEKGEKTLYAPCITTRADRIVELAERVIELGASAIMFNVIHTGISALQAVAEDPSIKVPIYVHRGGDMAFTKNPKHGIDFQVLCKLFRIAGGDFVHAGMVGGYINFPLQDLMRYVRALRDPMGHLKPMVPGMSGGAHPGNVRVNCDVLGKDFMILAGGGIMAHPNGPRAGAIAMRAAIDAAVNGIDVRDAAQSCKELRVAIEKWGVC